MRVKLSSRLPQGDYIIVTEDDWREYLSNKDVDGWFFSVNRSFYRNQYDCNRISLWFVNHVHLWGNRNLMKSAGLSNIDGRPIREFHYYYCNWWCFISNQRFCNKRAVK